MLVTTTLFLFFDALEAASESSYDNSDDDPDADYRYNDCHMEEVLMVLIAIKLSQKCFLFVPNVFNAALFYITVAYLLLRLLHKFSELPTSL